MRLNNQDTILEIKTKGDITMEILTKIMTESGFIFFACAALFAVCLRIFILQEQIKQEENDRKSE